MKILVANIGSTSFKYRLFATDTMTAVAQGRVERIGQPGSCCPDYDSAIRACLDDLVGPEKALATLADLNCVAFKAVHAGPLSGARLVDCELLAAMEDFAFFAPAHNPPYIAAMRAFGKTLPETPLVALLETAFFDKMDDAALTFSVPYDWKEQYGIRRYGFHGASHRAASEIAQQLTGAKIFGIYRVTWAEVPVWQLSAMALPWIRPSACPRNPDCRTTIAPAIWMCLRCST